jgi:hypothetical protein
LHSDVELKRRNSIAENACASSQFFSLRISDCQRNRGTDAVAADQVRQRERDAVAVWHAADARADRQDRPLVVDQHIDDPRDGAADAVDGPAALMSPPTPASYVLKFSRNSSASRRAVAS